MISDDIIVSIIGGSFAVVVAIITSKFNMTASASPENYQGLDYCQIIHTPILRFAGYPIFSKSHCNGRLSICQHCGKNFCPYHSRAINNKKLCCTYSSHICDQLVVTPNAEPVVTPNAEPVVTPNAEPVVTPNAEP